ncbi:hypothetical protein BU25DRAFT_162040 [Macroventuria anomochaeta]|uniref:Uncharacterized protein n=1 Tax=Macroventuria anomochaeta TaxID=301207 RepID=A0ACB6RQX2_9PLEO|nr:uncharacterized protein BU25DRAFT_162040 [Macroventuria anomochaeta]KAF2624133.1 hypothetical protein BU25DRAFT_162040 [Macroventuria anomochaeta]
MRTFHILLTALSMASSTAPVLAKCCGQGECKSWSPFPRPNRPDAEICNRWQCADGLHHGPIQCCGQGRCYVFCRNCDSVNGKGTLHAGF